jgi:hypothetical protein
VSPPAKLEDYPLDLEHEGEREAMTRAAYNLVSRDLSLMQSISQILTICGEAPTVPAEVGPEAIAAVQPARD